MGDIKNKEELLNLMNLLDEQDGQSINKISDCIVAYGSDAIPYLEATSENTHDSVVQSRIKILLNKIRFQNLFCDLSSWAAFNSDDLLKGYFLISKYFFPDIEEERVMTQVEILKKEVWLELKKDMTPYEQAKIISKVFFEVKKFSLNTDAASFTDSLCLNTLLDSGVGLSPSFCVLYAGIAQRLGIPIYGSNIPLSMFLAYVPTKNIKKNDLKNNVSFYLNPFKAGAFYTNLSIKEHIEKNYPEESTECIGVYSNTMFILDLISTMQYSLTNSFIDKDIEIFLELDMLVVAIKRAVGEKDEKKKLS